MPDAIFADPRLAVLYDIVDDDRSDLDEYERIVEELGAASVLDVGCGTGSLAVRLAARGIAVVGVDPAAASLEVAKQKPGADSISWMTASADELSLDVLGGTCAGGVDLALMTGNVAQVFVDDDGWNRTVAAVASCVRSGGWFVFETRDPSRRAWEGWTKERTFRELIHELAGSFATWTELDRVDPPQLSFRTIFVFDSDGSTVASRSTLCFRQRDEIEHALMLGGFDVRDVRDAPDRPGLEFVFFAQRR